MGIAYIWSLRRLCNMIEQILSNKYDCNIVIEGRRGTGKSTLAYKVCLGVKKFHRFNPYKDILYHRDDILDALANRNFSTIMGDEVIAVVHNRDFYNETQKQIIKTINVQRDRCNLFISCVPQFQVLDNQFKNLIKIRITVLKRGLAIIHTPVKSIYKTDIWDSSLNEKIEAGWLSHKGNFKPNYKKLTTFRGYMKFGDLTPKQREIYEKIKLDKRNVIIGRLDKEDGTADKKDYPLLIAKQIFEGKIDTEEDLVKAINMFGGDYNNYRKKINSKLKGLGEHRSAYKIFIDRKKNKVVNQQVPSIFRKTEPVPIIKGSENNEGI